jgi:cell division protein FtsQ
MVAARAQRKSSQTPRRRLPGKAALTLLAVTLLCAGAVASAYHYVTQPGRMPLRVIEVKGEFNQLRHAAIQRTVMDSITGGFFNCDMPKLRATVLAMPWVEDVSIRRVWPDRLNMLVTEQVPLARWGEDALINVNGGVFRPPALHDYQALIKLSGPQGSERRVVAFFQAIVPAARARQLQIDEVELDVRRHWWVRFDNGLTLSLGQDQIAQRLQQFFRVYPSLLNEPTRLPVRIDMRYAHGFAVRWRELPAAEVGQGTEIKQDTMREKV